MITIDMVILVGMIIAGLVVGAIIAFVIAKKKCNDDLDEFEQGYIEDTEAYEATCRGLRRELESSNNFVGTLKSALEFANETVAKQADEIKYFKLREETNKSVVSKYNAAKSLVNKLQNKLDDVVGDTAHLMDVAAGEVMDKVKKTVNKRKKRPIKKDPKK